MPTPSPLTHPVYLRARQAALARPELRFARAPAQAVTRLSNAPVRLALDKAWSSPMGASPSIPAEPPGAPSTTPPEAPPPSDPPRPEPAGPEITDLPPDTMPVPVREPPVMPQPMATF